MKESVALFGVILSSDYFYNASMILFLNKTDLFPECLAIKPLRYTYPEFDGNLNNVESVCLQSMFFVGADNDVEAAKQFIENKYLELASSSEGNVEKNIYSHFTCSVG